MERAEGAFADAMLAVAVMTLVVSQFVILDFPEYRPDQAQG